METFPKDVFKVMEASIVSRDKGEMGITRGRHGVRVMECMR